MSESKVIYLKDALANKSPSEILDMMPFMVCIEEHYPEDVNKKDNSLISKASIERNSYAIVGVTKDSILLGTTVYSENDDDFGWSAYTAHNSYIELKLNKLDNITRDWNDERDATHGYKAPYEKKYIFCHECTPKQKEFLVKYCDFDKDDTTSGYEAFHLIQEKTEEWQNKKNKKKAYKYSDPILDRLENMDMQDFYESGMYFDEPY